MDPNTAYRHLQLSDGGRKAMLKAENLNLPDHPERFHFWRQVLCREPLGGSPYYWEVEWTGHKVKKQVILFGTWQPRAHLFFCTDYHRGGLQGNAT